ETALGKSATLVFVANETALTRPFIATELELFSRTGRTIIPVDVNRTLADDSNRVLEEVPWRVIKDRDIIWIDEGPVAFARQVPSPSVAAGVDSLFKYTRRSV